MDASQTEFVSASRKDFYVPATRTVEAVLDHHGLVSHQFACERAPPARYRKPKPQDLWCTDYKREFMLADKRYCYPLTVTSLGTSVGQISKPALKRCLGSTVVVPADDALGERVPSSDADEG